MGIKLLILLGVLAISSASAIGSDKGGGMFDLNKNSVDSLMQKRIFFGHQSVGENILHGVELYDGKLTLAIDHIKDKPVKEYADTGILHRRVGRNNYPETKIDEFVKVIDEELQGKVDIAFLKLCYVDITSDRDIHALLSYYKKNMDYLKEKYPEVAFVHLTVPLRENTETWKTQLKSLLGKDDIWEYADNIKRNQYNQMLLNEYQGKEPIFDVAKIESTSLSGETASFKYKGNQYLALAADLTYDGGHLNDAGSLHVATELLRYLNSL
ncbi:hypothetical protein [uncultured Desulfuromusa sp.]|uniref:hypothetical protein n=1 Tax=uncultured Desulfuromusa sp. TaxID=219183 RepID=UPI002AA7A243|nr:hypothetical protein [uncultured Desulfuromusa sp.]